MSSNVLSFLHETFGKINDPFSTYLCSKHATKNPCDAKSMDILEYKNRLPPKPWEKIMHFIFSSVFTFSPYKTGMW